MTPLKVLTQFQVNISQDLIDESEIEVKIYQDGDKTIKQFAMGPGKKFIVYEHGGKLMAEEKKHFCQWKTISGYNANPHKNI